MAWWHHSAKMIALVFIIRCHKQNILISDWWHVREIRGNLEYSIFTQTVFIVNSI